MDVDLNLENYTLNDLLKLFNISFNFQEKELKDAKKIVLRMHPDKSKLDKKYFLFFSSAYKLLYNIYNFRNKSKLNQTIKRSGPVSQIHVIRLVATVGVCIVPIITQKYSCTVNFFAF